MPCQAIFKTLPTDRGMCCSFNMEKAEEIFQKSTYSALVQDMQSFDESKRYKFISKTLIKVMEDYKTYKLLFGLVLKRIANYMGFQQIVYVRQE